MSYAPNSIIARDFQLKRYLQFIGIFIGLLTPIPCDSNQVALYATWLARSLKYSSILNYLSGLNYFLKKNGAQTIDYSAFVVNTTLKGIRRSLGDTPKQAIPILPGMLRNMFQFLTLKHGHTAWRAAVLCSFRGLLRKSQVTDSESVLRRKDFKIFPWGMLVYLRRSKTIQFKERVLIIPISRCPDIALCAVHWTEKHFAEVQADQVSPAFLIPINDNSYAPLDYQNYQGMLKRFAEKAGINPDLVSSHSLRRGGCTYLANCGATLEEIKHRGDWASDAVFAYLKTPLTIRIINDMRVATSLAED